MTYTIKKVYAREVLDSRGNPTIEVEMTLNDGAWHRALVPSGASTGVHEALELRDGDNSRYWGKGVLKAVKNVNEIIAKAIENQTFDSFRTLDQKLFDLDGTKNKSNLWANAILGVSIAFVGACAKSEGKRIYEYLGQGSGKIVPYPMMNILNGGSHADNNVDVQEFMIVPNGAPNFHEGLRWWAEIFHELKKLLKGKGLATSVGDEGGFAPNLSSNEEALQIILEAIKKAGYEGKVALALDVAASEFYENGVYNLAGEGKKLNAEELIKIYENWCEKYPIIALEDGMDEDDFEGWKKMSKALGNKTILIGDDVFVTNMERLQIWIDEEFANAILIKLNQIGSVSETLDAIDMAKKNNMKTVISHRSWETEDTFIADLAVGINAGFIKTGSASRTERIAKYNQLLRIEEHLGSSATYGE